MTRGNNNFVGFFNNSNLKYDIQKRVSSDVENRFKDMLNYIKGDSNDGYAFSEVVKMAMAYFFSEIFHHSVKNEYYTLESVKGFLDADNKTSYTEIHNIQTPFFKLKNASLFGACWLIIQTAWFVNSEHFGSHQLIDYLNHYLKTGCKLPIENYRFDSEYLLKKYNDIDDSPKKIDTSYYVNYWFNSILFLVCCELQLPLSGFRISVKGDREYNPLTKCLRHLRPIMPFKISENDIKSAFVSFIDIETGADLAALVYAQLMKSKGITRMAAKKLFNTICNSGLKEYMTPNILKDFFYSCGYSEPQTDQIIQMVTNNDYTFYQAMTEYERQSIDRFNRFNALKGTARVHDAVMYIDQGIRPMALQVFSKVFFGHKEMNEPCLSPTYNYGKKWLPYAYMSSVPQGLPIAHLYEYHKPQTLGQSDGFIFYNGSYDYVSASFNLNNWCKYKEDNGSLFFSECQQMVCTLEILNKRRLTCFEIETIVTHIREHSNHIFDKRYLSSLLATPKGLPFPLRKRNYGFTEQLTFKKNIDFLNALNQAQRKITTCSNHREIFDLLSERITNNDYCFLTESYSLKGRSFNNFLVRCIIRIWNRLTSGKIRKPKGTFKNDSLYNTPIKSVKIMCPPSNAAIKKRNQRARKAQQNQKDLIENIRKAQQLVFIAADYAGLVPDVNFERNNNLISQLKADILNEFLSKHPEMDAVSFDQIFPLENKYVLQPNNATQKDFNADMTNSIFNQNDEIQAIQRGDQFYKEWNEFHRIQTGKEDHENN